MIALVVGVLVAPTSRVYASSMFGGLRAPGSPALVAAHRGDRASAPENTLPAITNALEGDLAFVEIDLQLTRDGVPVLMHDETVDRTTNGSGLVADFSLKKLQKLDAGKWYAKKFRKTRVPTFDEFLDVFAQYDKKAMVELKGFWTKDQAQVVADAIFARGVEQRILFESFDFTSLQNAQAVAPGIGRIIIRRDLPADPAALAREFDAIAILTSAASVEQNPLAVQQMHDAGYGLLLYTLNSEERWSEALALGVDGILTDEPSDLDAWLAETAPGT
jgi:glycerophosphoryl diester phosphodiesterase